MGLYFIKGKINLKTFFDFCTQHNIPPQKSVYLFPGNQGHHGPNHHLYSAKSGSGLAVLAGDLSRNGCYPVLSIPTTGMENWSTNKNTQKLVTSAIEDVWHAVGAGFNLVLPVRPHNNTLYFDSPLDNTSTGPHTTSYEPSFWGGVQTAANKPLANYYSDHLQRLKAFMEVKGNEERENAFLKQLQQDHPNLHQAYLAGKPMQPAASLSAATQPPSTHPPVNTESIKFNTPTPQASTLQPDASLLETTQPSRTPPPVNTESIKSDTLTPRASTLFMLGSGLMAAAGGIGVVVGALSLAGAMSLAFPPALLLIAGSTGLVAGMVGLGFFATTRYLEKDHSAPAAEYAHETP